MPENFIYGGGSTSTVLHPLVAVWVFIAVVLILTLSRNKIIVPFLLVFFTTPVGQVLVLNGVHLTMHQILILSVLARMVACRGASGARFPGGFNALDKVVVLWAVAAFVVQSLQWMQLQPFIKFLGDLILSLGGYLAARFLIPDREAVRRTVKVMAAICLLQGACMVREQFTHQNVFGFLEVGAPEIRDGHVRSNGVMGALYGGSFAGILIPLFLWALTEKKSRIAGCVGLAAATVMAFTSHATTSWMAYGAGILGLAFWPLREQMRLVRWGIVGTLAGLHIVMHGPVWSLIEKIDLTGGSSNYHRYMLVDNCIRNFSDWWLLGYANYGSWGYDMWDLCNQFVAVAVTGGLISLVLFIMIYSRSFGAIGNARKQVRGNPKQEWFLWCLGSALFAYLVASFGINYMVYLQMAWFPLLGLVSVEAMQSVQTDTAPVQHDSPVVCTSVPVVAYRPGNRIRR